MNICFTGHRPDTLWTDNIDYVRESTSQLLFELNPDAVITGMAPGYDLLAGHIALNMDIPIICAIPFYSHIKKDKEYTDLLDKAKEIVIVSPGPYFVSKLHKRNEWMVDNSIGAIAMWTGDTNGGTYNCIKYLKKVNKPWMWIDPIHKIWSAQNADSQYEWTR